MPPQEVKPEEVKAFFSGGYPRLLIAERELQPFQYHLQDVHDVPGMVPSLEEEEICIICQYDEIIGVAHHVRILTVSVIHAHVRPCVIEFIEVDVGQERGNDAALRRTLDRCCRRVHVDDACLEPLSDQREHIAVGDPLLHERHQ